MRFGIHLGAVKHFSDTDSVDDEMMDKIIDNLYYDLKLRLFRTSYEPFFSPSPHSYQIECVDEFTCTWIKIHSSLSRLPKDYKIFASVWSPPHYMKDALSQLKPVHEGDYYYFLTNITAIIRDKFDQDIELISPINEPENLFASWDHTNMAPQQLCRMVDQFNDTLISACPENSYYWVSQIYMNYDNYISVNCARSCDVIVTHAYALNILPISPNFLRAYYDLVEYPESFDIPVWQTEICSTYGSDQYDKDQMGEALDLALNIANFVGTTCVTRYYFWLSYTHGGSGESIMWGRETSGGMYIYYPKKYYVYRHYTLAASSMNGPGRVHRTTEDGVIILKFGDASKVFLNREDKPGYPFTSDCVDILCTNAENDIFGRVGPVIPPKSVCSCQINPNFSTTTSDEGIDGTSVDSSPSKATSLFQRIPNPIAFLQGIPSIFAVKRAMSAFISRYTPNNMSIRS